MDACEPSFVSEAPHASAAPANGNGNTPPPCFYWNWCSQRADVEKLGRSVCRRCAARLRGAEYPLRDPSLETIYLTGRSAAEAMDISDS